MSDHEKTPSSDGEGFSPRAREIVDTAHALLAEEGIDGLSMRRLADRVGIQAPSIYKHFADKHALEAALISDGFEGQARAFQTALEAKDGLSALAAAYRKFARENPHLYRLMTERPLERERLTPGAEARAAEPVVQLMGGDIALARALWAFAHGMTILELNERFPPDADLDQAWAEGLKSFRARS